MKKTFLNFPKYRLFILGFALILSCSRFDDLKSPIDGLKVLINYDIFETFLSFRFVDAASGSVIGSADDEKVKLNIAGESAGAIVDQMGNHETSYNSVYGLLSLALNPKNPWKPSPQNVLSLQLQATSTNYKPVNLNLKIDSTGKYNYRIMMEKLDVDQLGIKTYFLPLNLDKDGKLIGNFAFASSGNEARIQLKEGTQFQKAGGDIEKGSQVNLIFKVYTKTSNIPGSSSLLSDVVQKDGTTKKTAIDLYRAVDVTVKNSSSEILTTVLNYPIQLRYQIDKTAYHPGTKNLITPGNEIRTYTYQTKTTAWQLDDALTLKSDSLGYYALAETKSLALHSAGMDINLCTMNGDVSVKLQGIFPEYPVPAAVYYYRKTDARYIGSMKIDIPLAGLQQNLSFKVPENTPIRTYLWNYSNSNSFVATPSAFVYEAGCGTFPKYETVAATNSVSVSGKVKVKIQDDFPDAEFYINAQLYNASTNGLLWSKQYKISKILNEFDINASVPANQSIYLNLTSVKSENSFEADPKNIVFNSSAGVGKVWEFSITPLFSRVNLNFHFTRSSDLPANDYSVLAAFTNVATQADEGTLVFQLKQGQTDYTAQMFLSKTKTYKINLKRIAGKPEFMAYPYEFLLGSNLQNSYSFSTELSPVVRKTVTLTVKVVCKQTEIIPTLHGYYRTVWENDWKEGDIKNGVLTFNCEINATYLVGIIINGKMEISEYKINESDSNFEFKLTDQQCATMGW